MSIASFEENKNHLLIPCLNGKRVHSFYDPYKEAFRFLENHLKPNSKTVLIVGESGGFLTEAVMKQGKKVIAIIPKEFTLLKEFSKTFFCQREQDSSFLYPFDSHDSEENFFLFLESKLKPQEWAHLQILLWEPVVNQLKALYSFAGKIAQQILAKGSSFKTSQYFMQKWISNCLHHLQEPHHYYGIPRLERALFICAAGPSLNEHLPFLRRMQNRVYLMALSSALYALEEAEIQPDFIIQTDGGYWATQLLERANHQASTLPYLITTLAAGWVRGYPNRILLNQQTTLEAMVPDQTLFATVLSEAPSVACSALTLGLQMSKTLFFIGLDLGSENELTHAVPHPSINRLMQKSNQIDSFQQKLYSSYVSNSHQSLDRYRYWFAQSYKRGNSFYQIEPTFHPNPIQPLKQEEVEKQIPPAEKKKILLPLLKADYQLDLTLLIERIKKHQKALLEEYVPHLDDKLQKEKWNQLMEMLKS